MPNEPGDRRLLRPTDARRDHIRGGVAGGRRKTLLIYGDYLCPYCRRLKSVMDRLRKSLGERLGKAPGFVGTEAAEAWLVNTAEAVRLFGYPDVPLAKLIDWTADWVARGMPSLGKDTHYDIRDGSF